jgi:hypothetical protein
MSTSRKEKAREVIDRLGGSAKVAELLGYEKHGGVQRVQNWKERGIPASVLLDHPTIFSMPSPKDPQQSAG